METEKSIVELGSGLYEVTEVITRNDEGNEISRKRTSVRRLPDPKKPVELDEVKTGEFFIEHADEIQAFINGSKRPDFWRAVYARQGSKVTKELTEKLLVLINKEKEEENPGLTEDFLKAVLTSLDIFK